MEAKKRFGQHFLTSESALKKIIEAGSITPTDTILEIGPGTGVLTKELLKHAGKVIAIEKDRDLVPLLRDLFKAEIASGTLEIIEQDILDFDPESIPEPYKLIANIPYYITGLILETFLSSYHQPSRAVLLVQKEVAERVVARDGKESVLSISVKVYGKPTLVAKVPAGSFQPAPKVDSAILLIEDVSKSFFNDCDEDRFFDLLKFIFGKKRKQLAGSLAQFFNNKEKVQLVLSSLNLKPTLRPENLSPEQWKALVQHLG